MSHTARFDSLSTDSLPSARTIHALDTARLQTVSAEGDAWLHRLLQAVGQRTAGRPVLCNTSFNVKGKPIVNRAATALELLRTEAQLDYVWMEGWLFSKARLAG